MTPLFPVTLVSAGLRLESPGGKKVPTRRNNNIFTDLEAEIAAWSLLVALANGWTC